jgi:predicted nucleic acid-binding protein
MIIVSDTTPIISLIKIKRLSLLEELFGNIVIPEAVFNELTTSRKFKEEAELVRKSSFIELIPVTDKIALHRFQEQTGLDLGESEAIILANEIKADSLVIDERKGRRVANQLGLKITGTLGILLLAYEEKLLSKEELESELEELQHSSLRLSRALIQEIVDKL